MSQFGEILEINKFELDTEWLNQSVMYQEYLELLADARANEIRSKETIKVEKASLAQDVRQTPADYNFAKVTESIVSEIVESDSNIIEKVHEWIEHKHEVDILESAVKALEHRKTSLENLVKLSLSGYFSEPQLKLEGEPKEVSRKIVENLQEKEIETANKTRTRRNK